MKGKIGREGRSDTYEERGFDMDRFLTRSENNQ